MRFFLPRLCSTMLFFKYLKVGKLLLLLLFCFLLRFGITTKNINPQVLFCGIVEPSTTTWGFFSCLLGEACPNLKRDKRIYAIYYILPPEHKVEVMTCREKNMNIGTWWSSNQASFLQISRNWKTPTGAWPLDTKAHRNIFNFLLA